MWSNQSLANLNSFGLEVQAEQYAAVESVDELKKMLIHYKEPILILGGGSNILFTQNPTTAVVHNRILGKKIISETDDEVIVRVGAGENWHKFVLWSLDHGWGGLENLSLIPGTVGAAPIQNIGAYGVELKDVFYGLDALELSTGASKFFDAAACQFGYRSSVFKSSLKGKVAITQVYFRLSKKEHRIQTKYGAIQDTLTEWEINQPTIQDVSRAVIAIRQSKLPDPKEIGNAGSFFKNVEIDEIQFASLKDRFPNLIYYAMPHNRFKIPSGWLIDQCGWKGKRLGPVGCHAKQALVLVNYGGANGQQIVDLARQIMDSVEQKYGLRLEPEVNII